MNEQMNPEEEGREVPRRVETPAERAAELASDLRRRAEDLSYTVQERAKQLGEATGHRTREATDKIVFFSEEAGREASTRLGSASHYLRSQMSEVGENTRQVVREHPGKALGAAAVAGVAFAWFGRRFMESLGRR